MSHGFKGKSVVDVRSGAPHCLHFVTICRSDCVKDRLQHLLLDMGRTRSEVSSVKYLSA